MSPNSITYELWRQATDGDQAAFDKLFSIHSERLQAALTQLSDEHREVILLRYFQGLSAEEAGQRMQRSAGAIRNLLSRALVDLGKYLKPDEGTMS